MLGVNKKRLCIGITKYNCIKVLQILKKFEIDFFYWDIILIEKLKNHLIW